MSAESMAAASGLEAVRPGMRVEGFGLRQDWTVVALSPIESYAEGQPQALLLAVREHRHTPFVIERVYMQGATLVAYQGTYCETLDEALEVYQARGGRIGEGWG